MNRNFASGGKLYSMHVMPVMIDCTINIGAAGAVSSITGPLVNSVTRTSQGIYKIHISEPLSEMYVAMGAPVSPVSGLSGVCSIEIANAPKAAIALASDPSLTVKVLSAAGALVDPASGSAIKIVMICSNSSVKVQGE